MTYWRQAGLTYLQFSSIAARLVRRAVKAEFRFDIQGREESLMKKTLWKDGKAVKNSV
uniref:ATP synthase subunit epsilon, mitochondrial n=1 Tax=Hadrurus spadix TaxID=141984 RepID=A0A1W7RAZ0_9SCOR